LLFSSGMLNSTSTHIGRVLLAYEDESLRTLLQKVFEQAGYEVELSRDREEAIARLESEHRPDLLVLDIEAWGRDGWTVLDRLQRRADAPAAVVLTDPTSEEAEGPIPDGVAAMLSKPFSPAMLVGICEALMPAHAPAPNAH
jgi:CheY-like chemotaxis protein